MESKMKYNGYALQSPKACIKQMPVIKLDLSEIKSHLTPSPLSTGLVQNSSSYITSILPLPSSRTMQKSLWRKGRSYMKQVLQMSLWCLESKPTQVCLASRVPAKSEVCLGKDKFCLRLRFLGFLPLNCLSGHSRKPAVDRNRVALYHFGQLRATHFFVAFLFLKKHNFFLIAFGMPLTIPFELQSQSREWLRLS